ncbi:multiple sugar transport system permease protein [Thermocatellispora tengchongensis]|uniref:Multiple sugar transport system permease protein n=1 Tax=Thermocatellispora tengchongensis TaxID=1073253 RepID=A0A840P165_9ACTN|nr:carbohydrate ABC transporter permease [Thermocatellispora tengchongensis]MBB5134994.1 multiple sugar transport system permease protein [Thermocatellispora tengchongensis]
MTAVAQAGRSTRGRAAHRSLKRTRRGKSLSLTVIMLVMFAYAVLPLFWLLANASKTSGDLFSTFGLWFGGEFNLFANIDQTLSYNNGIFLRWFGNTVLYSVVGAGGAALLATVGGYALAKYDFPGRKLLFAMVLGGISIPGTALAVPTYLLFSQVGIVDTPWAVLIPALCSPFGLYLMRVYAADAVPDSILESARIDGAGELRIFRTIALRLLAPGFVTVLLFSLVATWNNYFLPLIVLNTPDWFPLTVGLNQWNAQANSGTSGAGDATYSLILTGSLLSIVPLIIAFLVLQRFWQSGLATGSVKQ